MSTQLKQETIVRSSNAAPPEKAIITVRKSTVPPSEQERTVKSSNTAFSEHATEKKSNAAPPEKVITVKNSNKALQKHVTDRKSNAGAHTREVEDLGAFYLQKKYSDITLIAEEQEIHAHKIVLAARCKYFERLLPDDATMTTLTLDNAPFEAFGRILKYIYTGDMSIEASNGETIFDVIRLAHEYSLTDLEQTVKVKLNSILDMTNVFKILNKATEYDHDEVKETCYVYVKKNISQLLESDFLNVLKQKSMINLLEKLRVTVPELKIFQIVEKWCGTNEDVDNLVKNCVRLTNLSSHDLLWTVWPSKIFEDAEVRKALDIIQGNVPQRVMDKNIATVEFKAKAITGNRTNLLLMSNNDLENYAYHPVCDKKGITIDLGKLFYFNYIKLNLKNNEILNKVYVSVFYTHINFYKYYIEVSRDLTNWKKILDYTNYNCRSYQNLYCEQQLARYIRIVGTHSSESGNFEIVRLKIYCKNETPAIINQIVRPTENVATADMGAIVTEGRLVSFLLNGDIKSGSTGHIIGAGYILVQLGQPYMISSMRLLLHNDAMKNYKYSYIIETSVDRKDWKIAADRRNQECEDWQDLQFEERPVIYIRIIGTSCSYDSYFRCRHLECPTKSANNK